jgi:hypothetical protein
MSLSRKHWNIVSFLLIGRVGPVRLTREVLVWSSSCKEKKLEDEEIFSLNRQALVDPPRFDQVQLTKGLPYTLLSHQGLDGTDCAGFIENFASCRGNTCLFRSSY